MFLGLYSCSNSSKLHGGCLVLSNFQIVPLVAYYILVAYCFWLRVTSWSVIPSGRLLDTWEYWHLVSITEVISQNENTLKYLITDRMELPTKRSLLAKNNKQPECNKQPEGQIWKFDKQPWCNLLEFGHEHKPKVQNTEPFSTAIGFIMLLAGHLVKVSIIFANILYLIWMFYRPKASNPWIK